MRWMVALVAVIVLAVLGTAAGHVGVLRYLFGVIIPYLALGVFVVGFVVRVLQWTKIPVPFRIPTTCGQQTSLPWIKGQELDNPHTTLGVIARMALEVFFFRSLLRNTRTEVRQTEDGPKVVYNSNLWLWGFGLAFHWAFLIIVIRHLRFFADPVPFFVAWTEWVDGMIKIGVPVLYLTDIALIGAVSYLFARRVYDARLRYISLPGDYFPLFLILAIGITGALMRYFPASRVNIEAVKDLGMSLITFKAFGGLPADAIGGMFYVHFFLVCCLVAYFPLSKLMHMGGVFLSPTRNLANNNRAVRHINPWELETHPHTYAEYEDEFRPVMAKCGLPLDKPLPEEE
jgi:nitrate reductase gamma subunit